MSHSQTLPDVVDYRPIRTLNNMSYELPYSEARLLSFKKDHCYVRRQI